ncbi:MAG: methyltransferase [Bacteroidota bacterium]
MSNVQNSEAEQQYWSQRYEEERTGWDIGYPSTPLKTYFDQLREKTLKVLIPGAGNAYEAEYLFQQGFSNVFVLDIAQQPLDQLKRRVPNFPSDHLICANFFNHQQQYDLIVEQTFFCSFPPTPDNRKAYARQMASLLAPGGKLVGLWFNFPLTGDMEKRPFGGDQAEYLRYFEPYFHVKTLEPCHNSIPPRQNNELFGIFEKM